jgi:integrase
MPRRLPAGCVEDRDRHGKIRVYYRPPGGGPKTRLLGTPWTPDFMTAYEVAKAAGAPPKRDDGRPVITRSTEGTWRWLCEQCFGRYVRFIQMTPETRDAYRRRLESTYDEPIAPTDRRTYADVPIKAITPKAVRVLRDRRMTTPAAADALIKAMRLVFDFAIEDELITVSPAAAIDAINRSTEGHHTWTIDEARQFEERHSVGSQARLAYALMLYTGARVSDVRLFGRQHISDGWLNFKPKKTKRSSGIEVDIPVLDALQRILEATPSSNLTFLMTHQHKPYTARGLSNRMRDWCDEAKLPQCSAHGLRKAGATLAAENGATEHQLMAIYGWTTARQAEKYTRRASRKRLAGDAMGLIKMG